MDCVRNPGSGSTLIGHVSFNTIDKINDILSWFLLCLFVLLSFSCAGSDIPPEIFTLTSNPRRGHWCSSQMSSSELWLTGQKLIVDKSKSNKPQLDWDGTGHCLSITKCILCSMDVILSIFSSDSFVNSQEWTLSRSVPDIRYVCQDWEAGGWGGGQLKLVDVGVVYHHLSHCPSLLTLTSGWESSAVSQAGNLLLYIVISPEVICRFHIFI